MHTFNADVLHSWYHAVRTRDEADDYLAVQPSGAFLVRVSGNKNGYSLSAKYVTSPLSHQLINADGT